MLKLISRGRLRPRAQLADGSGFKISVSVKALPVNTGKAFFMRCERQGIRKKPENQFQ